MALAHDSSRLARAIHSRLREVSAMLQTHGIKAGGTEKETASRLRRLPVASLTRIGEALGLGDGPGSGGRARKLDQLAAAVLALPDSAPKLSVVERAVVAHALSVANGNKSAAARLLGMDRKAFERRVQRLDE